jgi:hypothetical protein
MTPYVNHRPSLLHEERRAILDSMAILAGYQKDIRCGFPDGSLPDVLRFDPTCGVYFLGEAKDSESPGCSDTRSRLNRYVRWLRVIREDRFTVAICFGCRDHVTGWSGLLQSTAAVNGLQNYRVAARELDWNLVVVCLYAGQMRSHLS